MNKAALIIGNNDYQFIDKLNVAIKDAENINQKLKELGFITLCESNIKRDERVSLNSKMRDLFSKSDIGLFYFAGHGLEINKFNYLMCVDNIIDESLDSRDIEASLKYDAIKLDEIISIMQECELKTKIIILDVCRSPIKKTASRGGFNEIPNLAPVQAENGMIICYATSPGQSAIEGENNGYYTESILKTIDLKPGITIENLFKRVRIDVNAKTNGKQVPWEHTSLIEEFSFYPYELDGTFSSKYDMKSLADKSFIPNDSDVSKKIIEDLKSHNWYTQNPAVNIFINKLKEGYQFNKDDLFVIGRNIYQAAVGNSIEALNFIGKFSDLEIAEETLFHILNGMSYEIYFNLNGKLRKSFKSEYIESIIDILMDDAFSKSKNFILSKISELQIPIFKYEENKDASLIFQVNVEETNKEGKFCINEMRLNGNVVDFDIDDDDIVGEEVFEKTFFEDYIKKCLCAKEVTFAYNISNELDILKLAYPASDYKKLNKLLFI